MKLGSPSQTAVLSVQGLMAGYGRIPVLYGIDLSIDAGEIVGILGHNGMGKTSLLKTIMGFLPATSGRVLLDGDDITSLASHRRALAGLGYVPQGRDIFSQLSVRDNLRLAWHARDGESAEEALAEGLRYFPRIERLLDRPGGSLSGGEQQLLALARCLMSDPWFLLLDEPTEGIQPSIIEEIEETLSILRRDRGLTILLVEQNFDFITTLSDRVMVLERGKIMTEIDTGSSNASAQIEAFLGFGALRKGSHRTPEQNGTNRHDHSLDSTDSADSGLPIFGGPIPNGAANPIPAPSFVPQSPYSGFSAHNDHRQFSHSGSATELPPAYSAHQTGNDLVMTVRRPTLDHLRTMSMELGFSISDAELHTYLELMEPHFQAYDRLETRPDFLPEVKYPRAPGYRPDPADNKLNAWYYKTEIRGAAYGPLAGKRIAIKDTVCVAGVPMMNGSSIMEGYIPEIDATIVTRILDAGGIIAGKSTCENLCLSGGSHTSATGPVHNPYKRGYMAGGSSSGSAVLVSSGEVDMAIAGDQGGSIRIPSCNCGVYGMKPTHGLVPYTGSMGVDPTIDHLGPITQNVADNALFLEVLAGADGLDPRQYAPKTDTYTQAVGRGCQGLKIGLVREGFGRAESEPDVDQAVREAAEKFKNLGCVVEEISLPEHTATLDYWTAITLEGLQNFMMHGNGVATGWKGLYQPSLIDHFASWRNRADELSNSLKICLFIGEFFQTRYRGRFYGKAQNLVRRAAYHYGAMFRQYDLILMPTLPMKPQPIPPSDAPLGLYIQRAFEMVGNTAPYNCLGFPAMNVPCALREGLPVGLMLIADNYNESTIYRAASAFEGLGDWRNF